VKKGKLPTKLQDKNKKNLSKTKGKKKKGRKEKKLPRCQCESRKIRKEMDGLRC
jgi:hypothetical protein